MNRQAVLLLLASLAALAAGAATDWYRLHPDSLLAPTRQAGMPRIGTSKLFYLEQGYGLYPSPRRQNEPESLNVRLVGKWGGGPSWGVTGHDTLVYLSRGSEVVALSFADPKAPRILNHIQARRLAARPVLADTLLYLATSGYIEVFNVKDPANAQRVGRLALTLSDLAVESTLVYTIARDSFKVYDFRNPASPVLLGACRDSGYALDYDRGYAYLRDRWGMYILDVRDPASPRRVASWGTDIAGVKTRGDHCYVAQGSMGSGSLHILNVSNPASPWQEGVLSGTTGEGIHLVDTFAFLPGFDVVSIANPSQPRLVAHAPVDGYLESVWVDEALRTGLVAANYAGLHVFNLADVAAPVLDTVVLAMGDAVGISVRDGLACIAGAHTGMAVLDVSDPELPSLIGRYDTTGTIYSEAVVMTDSFAFVEAFVVPPREVLHVVDISDPSKPTKAGVGIGFGPANAMALRDSFLYCAEDYKFEVFNVSNPRQPVWRGRCNSLEIVICGLDVQGRYAYEIAGAFGLAVINVADPANPSLVSTTTGRRVNSAGIAVRDTFAYVPSAFDTLWVLSVANPVQPRFISGTPIGDGGGYDICLQDSYAYLGCVDFHVFDVSSPAQPVRVGYHESPYRARKVTCDSSYIYVAGYLAGVAVYEMLQVGVEEPGAGPCRPEGLVVGFVPNPAKDHVKLELPATDRHGSITVRDAAGRTVLRRETEPAAERRTTQVDLSKLRSGVYFVEVDTGRRKTGLKLVKR